MQATGILIDGSFLRYARVRRTNQNLLVLDQKSLAIADPNVKPLYTPSANESLVSGINSNDLIIRSHVLTPAKKGLLKQALILQTEAQLHLKAEDLITASVIDRDENRATTYSTTRLVLSNHLQKMKELRLDPERVGAIPAALHALVHWKAPELKSYFLLDIGLSTTNCIWVENDVVQKAHAITLGVQQLKNAFYEDRKKIIALREQTEIDFSVIKTNQYPTLAEEARSFRREISKLLHSFQCQRPLIFTGEMQANGFREFLLETLHDCISEEKKIGLSFDEQRYAVCIGLSIDYLVNRDQPIQFRMGNDLSKHNWRKLGSQAAFLLAASGLMSALLWGVGSWWIEKREGEIVQNLESWTATKDPVLRLELFSAGTDIKDLVARWFTLIEKNSKDYRFLMKAPKVSQFLDWLSHHPLIEPLRSTDPISFEQIRYQLVSYPHLDAMDDPYLVKIELNFKVASPLHARKFHETLLQGDGLIDTSRDMTWEVLPDHYQASFYLKNV